MGRGNNRRGGRGGGGGGRGGGGQGRANASEATSNTAAPEQPKEPKPSKQQQRKSKKQKNQEPAEPAGEAGMGWTRRNREAQQQQQQADVSAAAAADLHVKPAAAPSDSNPERNARGDGKGRGGGGDNRRTAKNPGGGNGRGRGNAKKSGKGRGGAGGDNAVAAKNPSADGAENAASKPNDAKKNNGGKKKGKAGNNSNRRNRIHGSDNKNAKTTDGTDAPKVDLPAIAAPQPRKKVAAGPTDDGAANAQGYDHTTGKQGKRRVRPAAKKGNKKGAVKPSHSDPFADPVGEHRHTERTEPENVHGHALLEGDVEGSEPSDLPEALRSGMSSSAMGEEEEGEEVASSDGDGDGTDEDFSDTANERQKEYRPGGYHPVYIGEVYNERYRVVHKLGWGYFSTVWLVWDYKGHGFHAMKVQKSAQHYRDAAYDEIKLLTQIMGADPTSEHCCARMTDSFEHVGPHGTHVVMIFDVLGENLLKLMERYEYKGIPIPIVKAIAKQTLIGLRHIHSIEIIHTDLKPENVLLQTPKHGIVNIMKRYKAPAVSENLSLLERDRTMMTKSQRRRYDAKVRKLKREANEKQSGTAAAAAPNASESDSDEGGTAAAKKGAVVDPSRAAERSADGGGIDAQDLSAEVSAGVKAAEAAVNASDSDTDPEWEVQRFQNVCLADFGNSCWTYKQFADEVQTRQYRCPEVIIGDPYGCAIDLWSAACMFFELLTGEFLFDPKESGEYPRDEDHLALIMELQGPLPPHMAMGRGKFRSQFFNSHGELRHIKDLRFWGIRDVLHKKYRFSNKKANEIAEFLLPMLALDQRERATAAEMLEEFADFFDPVDDDFAPACFSTGESDDEEEEPERMPRPFSCRQDAAAAGDDGEDDEEEDVETWLANHPLLHPDQLASMGLKLDDVTAVLQGSTLPDPRKQKIVDMIIERMQEDMAAYEDEDEAAAAENAAEEEEEEEDDDDDDDDEAATTDRDTTGSDEASASAEQPAVVASTNTHVDPQAGTGSE